MICVTEKKHERRIRSAGGDGGRIFKKLNSQDFTEKGSYEYKPARSKRICHVAFRGKSCQLKKRASLNVLRRKYSW